MKRRLLRAVALAALSAAACSAMAQAVPSAQTVKAAEPDTRSIIEALLPTSTRSMRNLVVRAKPAQAASAATLSTSATTSATTAPADGAASAPALVQTVAAGATASAPPVTTPAPPPGPVATAPAAATPSPPAGAPPSLALDIQFASNSARVRPESGPLLGTLVAAMQSPELKAARFVIEGHADPRGATAQNQRLSQERADEVRLYLVALGVHPSRLRAIGKGAGQLANHSDPGAAANRRVRVVTVE